MALLGASAAPLAAASPTAALLLRRGFAAAAAAAGPAATTTAAAAAALTPSPGLIEIREYTLKPEGVGAFMKTCAEYAAVRRELLPFLGLFTTDVGPCLHRVTHFYGYRDWDERDKMRGRAAADPRWRTFVDLSRAHVQFQENRVLLEARPIYEALRLPHTAHYAAPPKTRGAGKAVYEMRSYQLHPGYGSVPKLVQAFSAGLPSKVAADPDGQLVLFGYTDVGMLNNVVELWRYPSAAACIKARQAARGVPEWREAIAAVTPGVQHFTSAFMHPAPFSPWQ